MSLAMETPPDAKKLCTTNLQDWCKTEVDSPVKNEHSPETAEEGQNSPDGPSSARSSNGSPPHDDPSPPHEDLATLQQGNLNDFLMQSLLNGVFKMDDFAPMLLSDPSLHASLQHSMPLPPPAPVVPGAVALANMPTAKLFQKDDWSWHRNPAASIRSGGTNKQTPVWKYFVYNKEDNLSRCIVADCTYTLKGPHTSTLACHLKKHTVEYAEFTKLKNDYSRERAVSQMPPSPASSVSGNSVTCSTTATATPSAATAKLTEAMLQLHNNNNEQQHAQQMQKEMQSTHQQMEQMHQAVMAAAAAATAASNGRPKSNGSTAHRLLTPPPSHRQQPPQQNNHQQQQQQQQQQAAAAAMLSPFSYLFPNPGAGAAAATSPLLAQQLQLQQAQQQAQQNSMAASLQQMTKKWRKDERKQREMEHRLSLFISSARLPSSIVNDAAFRELLESAQPKFACPTDASQIEQVLTAQQGRLQMAVRQAIHSVRRLCLMVDCVEVGDRSFRIAVSVSLPTPSGCREQLLLALRPIELEEDEQLSSRVVEGVMQQVMAENGLSSDKITRVITNGVERDERTTLAGVQRLIAYRPRLLAAFMHIIDSNERVQELKKRFCELIVTLVSKDGLMTALMQTIGGPVHLPFTETFVAILEAIFAIQEGLMKVLRDAGIEVLSTEDWKLAKMILAVLSCLSKSVANHDSIDTLLPSLMQILGILNENEEVSGGIGDELRAEIENLCGSITSPDESVMESDFLVATALNPERILLLNEEQLAYARRELHRRVQERTARQEEAASRKRPFSCLDQLLHKVANVQNGDDHSISSIYPDFGMKKEPAERNRFAEAIVQAYFDEVTQSDSFSTASSFSNRHLPPTAFWHANTHRCPQLAEIALELLSIPASTPGVEGLFGVKAASFDGDCLLQLPERLERDTLLRFNRALVPKGL